MTEEAHNAVHGDRRHPGTIASEIITALIIAIITGVVTAGATSYATIQILETKLSSMDNRLTKVENLATSTAAEQQRRTYYVYPKRK